MAKSKNPEDEKNQGQNEPPKDQPGGDQGSEFVAPGPNPTGTPEQPQETPTPPTGTGEKPQTIVVGPEGEPVKGPEYQEPEAPPAAPAAQPEAPKTFKHKSGQEIPYADFDDENIVWAEKYDAAHKVWDARQFTRVSWDKMTAGQARRFRGQSHSGWTRLAPALPEWSGFDDLDDDNPEGGEGRDVGPRPRDRNNP